MAFFVAVGAARHFDHRDVSGVERTDELLQDRPFARPGPAFEQDDGTFAVHDLRQLRTRQAFT